jgi:phosphoadenosine phosphosulfate reductase
LSEPVLIFPETYALLERIERRYGVTVDRVRPALSVAVQNVVHGDALWARDPDACCALRKIEPLRRHLRTYDAWMTAIRRDQSRTRNTTAVRAWDAAAQVVKVAPLADWTEARPPGRLDR